MIFGDEHDSHSTMEPLPRWLTALLVAIYIGALAYAAAANWEREQAFDDARLREHQERLERARPGALERLRDLAHEREARITH